MPWVIDVDLCASQKLLHHVNVVTMYMQKVVCVSCILHLYFCPSALQDATRLDPLFLLVSSELLQGNLAET